jgi:hypothetical protein
MEATINSKNIAAVDEKNRVKERVSIAFNFERLRLEKSVICKISLEVLESNLKHGRVFRALKHNSVAARDKNTCVRQILFFENYRNVGREAGILAAVKKRKRDSLRVPLSLKSTRR